MMYRAIESVGKATLVLKGTEPIDTTEVWGLGGMRNDATLNLTPAAFEQHIKPLLVESREIKTDYPLHKLVMLRFCPFTGLFFESNLAGDEKEAVDAWLDDVRIVDLFNLRWGMVPESFGDVKLYREALTQP